MHTHTHTHTHTHRDTHTHTHTFIVLYIICSGHYMHIKCYVQLHCCVTNSG